MYHGWRREAEPYKDREYGCSIRISPYTILRACEEFYRILQAGVGLKLLKIHRSNDQEEKLDSEGEPRANWKA